MKPTVNVAFSSERVWTFLTLVGQRKSHGKKGRRALWLHMKEKKYVAAIVKKIICHISPHFTAKKKKEKKKRQERPKAEGEAMLRFEETWMEWVVVRPPEGCQLPLSLILLQDFAP